MFIMNTQEAVLEALKKKQQRAARFGLPPPVANDPEEREKQRRRMQRFGGPEAWSHFQPAQSAAGVIRPDTLYVHGVDYLSSDQVTSYFAVFYPESVEWLNDSTCNVKFPSAEVALLAYNTNAVNTKLESLENHSNVLVPAFGYRHEDRSIPLQLRFSTDQDLKSAEVTGTQSQYYQWRQGLLNKPITRRHGRKPQPTPLEEAVEKLDVEEAVEKLDVEEAVEKLDVDKE